MNNALVCHRCNIAVILLTDLIIDHSVKVEWGSYLHLLLHAIFIGNTYSALIPSFYIFVIIESQYVCLLFTRCIVFYLLVEVELIYNISFRCTNNDSKFYRF